jgi:hypothetical protein
MALMNFLSKKTYVMPIGAVGAVIFFFALWLIPISQSNLYRAKFSPQDIQKLDTEYRIQLEKSASDIENSARLTLAQIVGGFALLFGLYFTYQNVKNAHENLRIIEEGKLTERFSDAIELLGSDKLEVRLGGIYALERISLDSPEKYHETVMEILTAFIRTTTPFDYKKEISSEEKYPKPREDIQTIITIIGNRKNTEKEKQGLDLEGSNLSNGDLRKVNLKNADLNKTNLTKAFLKKADLSGAELYKANLTRAYLEEATLIGAKFEQADLSKADLSKADLSEADLSEALNLTLNQLLKAINFKKAKLSPELEKELKEWQAKQPKEKSGAGAGSSANQAGE